MLLLRIFLLVCLLCDTAASYGIAREESTRAKRIVSLSPAVTAMLGELGRGDNLVGITRYCQLSGSQEPRPQVVGGAADPSVESVLALKPDIIIASSLLPDNIEGRFLSLGLKVKKFRQDKLNDILEQVLWLGEYTRSSDQAADEIAKAKAIIERAQQFPVPENSALLIFSDKIELVAGGDTYASEVMALAGLSNVASSLSQPWPIISHEWLLAQNPDWILIATHLPESEMQTYRQKCLNQWKSHPALSQLSAVQHERILTLPDNQLGVPSLRLFTAIEELRQKWQPAPFDTDMVGGSE